MPLKLGHVLSGLTTDQPTGPRANARGAFTNQEHFHFDEGLHMLVHILPSFKTMNPMGPGSALEHDSVGGSRFSRSCGWQSRAAALSVWFWVVCLGLTGVAVIMSLLSLHCRQTKIKCVSVRLETF